MRSLPQHSSQQNLNKEVCEKERQYGLCQEYTYIKKNIRSKTINYVNVLIPSGISAL